MERIGFIGLGLMGKPMATNLLKAGYSLMVYNRSPGPMAALAEQGAQLGNSPQQLAECCDVVMTCVSDSPDVEAIVFGDSAAARPGLLAAARPGLLFIDHSTIAPASARKIHQAFQAIGAEALDAPVSGGDIGAQQGTLSIMVGGSEAAFERSRPILQVLGRNIVYMGAAGAGQVTKACNQIVVALTLQAVAEALTLAKASGVDPANVRQALLGGFAQSRVLDVHGQRMLDATFQPGFKLNLHRKDMAIVLQTAQSLNLPLLGAAQITQLMSALIAQGHGDLDNSALITLYEQLSGL
jgi:2-hydroxy-3-oxopropionate reductase